jgi:hypothetical protein
MSDFLNEYDQTYNPYEYSNSEDDFGIIWGSSQSDYDQSFDDVDQAYSLNFKNRNFENSSPYGVYTPYKPPFQEEAIAKILNTPRKSIKEIIAPGDSSSDVFDYLDEPSILKSIVKFQEILKFQNEEILKKLSFLEEREKKRNARVWYKRRKKDKPPYSNTKRKHKWRKVLPSRTRIRWRKKGQLISTVQENMSRPDIKLLTLDYEDNDTSENLGTEFDLIQEDPQIESYNLQSLTITNTDSSPHFQSPSPIPEIKARRNSRMSIREEFENRKITKAKRKIQDTPVKDKKKEKYLQKERLRKLGITVTFSTSSSES